MLCFAAVVLAVGGASQPTISQQARTVVRLDAVVVDTAGRPVEDLDTSDFELRTDGGLRPIDRARLIRDAPRLFALFLDEYHVSPGAMSVRARSAALRFVDDYLAPDDALVVLKPLDALSAISLSTDHILARRTIEAFEGRLGDLEPRTAFERSYIARNPARVREARAQIVISALNALATHLGTLGAVRTSLVVVSEGFTGPSRSGRDALPTVRTVVRAANSNNVVVYQIDPRDRVARSNSDSDVGKGLRDLTAATGGVAVSGGSMLDDGLRVLVADAMSYYVLEFGIPSRPTDGRFHPVDLRVARPGVELRTRRGYYALTPSEAVRGRVVSRAPESSPPLSIPRRRSRLINPWVGFSRGTDGLTRVRIVWEAVGGASGTTPRRLPPSRVSLTALTASGDKVYTGVVHSSEPGVGSETPDAHHDAVFNAPAGKLLLQMSIEDVTSAPIDTDVRDVIVRALEGPLVLGTAEVLRARTALLFQAIEADSTSVPVAAREFSRTERLLIRVPVYASAGAPMVRAQLASRIGGVIRDLAVDPPGDGDVFRVELALASLAPGEYSVDVIADGAGQRAVESVRFRVTP